MKIKCKDGKELKIDEKQATKEQIRLLIEKAKSMNSEELWDYFCEMEFNSVKDKPFPFKKKEFERLCELISEWPEDHKEIPKIENIKKMGKIVSKSLDRKNKTSYNSAG